MNSVQVVTTFDEEIVPNPNNVGSSLPRSPTYLDTNFDPTNFLKTEGMDGKDIQHHTHNKVFTWWWFRR